MRYLDTENFHAQHALVCVHGIARNAHDFAYLAETMSEHGRVICPDIAGRGASDWLKDKTRYVRDTYLSDLNQLLSTLDGQEITYLGSSMGGMLGMRLAAMPDTPIRRLVLIDIGPVMPGHRAARLGNVLGMDIKFDNLADVEACLRMTMGEIGPMPDANWHFMAESSVRRLADGRFGLAFDPGIAEPFKTWTPEDTEVWSLWDQIKCPVFVMRGERSRHLSADVLSEMQRRGPPVQFVQMPGCGHPPHLMTNAHIEPVRDWLLNQWGHTAAVQTSHSGQDAMAHHIRELN
jgi:pimeloyl-ACP methyl ester carboxylesterase